MEDGRRRRLSPVGMIGAAVLLIVLVVVVVSVAGGGDDDDKTSVSAGGGSTTAPARSSGGAATREETLVLGQYRPPTGKIGNPYVQASDALVSDGLHELVYEALFYVNYQTGETEPWLATGYEYSDDNRTITLRLRDDVSWNDGKPFSADDVVYTMRQILAARAPFRAANIQGAVRSIRKLSPTEVRIDLRAPNPRFVDSELSSYVYTANFIPLPKHVFEGQRFETFAFYDLARGLPLGTGPYRLTDVTASAATLQRNDDWWAARAGVADVVPKKVVYTSPGPEDSAVSGLESSALDYAGQSVPSVAGFIAAKERNPQLVNWDGDLGWLDPCPYALTVNTKRRPWDDAELRWALNASIDKEQFSRLFNTPGESTPARTTYPEYPQLSELIDANEDLLAEYPTLDHDLDRAAQIFESKGYRREGGVWTKDGQKLSLKLNLFSPAALGPVWGDAAQLLNQQLREAGIAVEVDPGDFNTIAANRAEGRFDAQSWFECGSVTDPWATLNRYTNAPGNDNAGRWSNAAYDRIVAQMGELPPGDAQIRELYAQAMEIWLRELPVIPLNQRPTPIVMNQTYWRNWPTADNGYTQPAPFGMNFHQVITRLQSARGEQ
ncbi:ABC transporter substrate-binding protein [Conexibacter woesei]|uniref:Extracellular solute-binding protein family 5 n=1 Tax=Conexibacter woesei (strain DSM 14684 / CCUG 47730 / CIP 108061 / JCM 11494 / NBRC 100937 / ID131577) TaxID=469383 RepID=D3F7R1_CONWI|nr:ABC transporter substrate-binding protein [Conexibacter woesei]ADB50923.1 extracellular solute-binding protein family 5 [Conexibacter woesei DSM 14684]